MHTGLNENMTTREKIEHIWYYYKIHILAVLFLIIAIVSFTVETINKKDSILNVTLMGKYIDANKQEQLKKQLDNVLVDNPKKQEVKLDFVLNSKGTPDGLSYEYVQKIIVLVAAGDMDVMVMDKETFDSYAMQGFFRSIDEIPEISNIPSSQIVKAKSRTDNNNLKEGNYGIKVDNVKLLKDAGFDTENKVIAVIANTKHIDKAVKFINMVLENK